MSDPRNHFELFGLPVTYRIDSRALDDAYRALQSEVHPDRHAAAHDAARRAAIESSTNVNAAYRALKDPVERASYLLSLRGVDAFDEGDTRLSIDFLEAQLERREQAAEAAAASDIDALDRILAGVRAEMRTREQDVARLLDDDTRPQQAKSAVRELKFLAKVAEDVDAMLASLD